MHQLKVGAPFTLGSRSLFQHCSRCAVRTVQNGAQSRVDASSRHGELVPNRNMIRFRTEAKVTGALITYRRGLSTLPTTGRRSRPTSRHHRGQQPGGAVGAGGRVGLECCTSRANRRPKHSHAALQREKHRRRTTRTHGKPSSSAKDLLPRSGADLVRRPRRWSVRRRCFAIESYVRDLGGGFVMVGGKQLPGRVEDIRHAAG